MRPAPVGAVLLALWLVPVAARAQGPGEATRPPAAAAALPGTPLTHEADADAPTPSLGPLAITTPSAGIAEGPQTPGSRTARPPPAVGASDLAAPTAPLPAVLTLAQAEEIFWERGFALLLADAAVQGAEGDVAAAEVLPNPLVSGNIGHAFGYSPSQCTAPGCSATGVNVSLSDQGALVDLALGRRRLRRRIVQTALDGARQGQREARRASGLLLRQAFLHVAVDRAQLDFARQMQQLFAHTQRLFALRYRAGAVSETDLARIETAALGADGDVDTAVGAEVQDRLDLAYLLGSRGVLPDFAPAVDWLEQADESVAAEVSAAELLDVATKRRPDLAAALLEGEAARRRLQLTEVMWVPQTALNILYSGQGSGQDSISPPTLSVGLTFELPAFNQYRGEVRRARAELRQTEVGSAAAAARIAAEVQAARSAVSTSRTKLQRLRTRQRARAGRALELVQLQYTKGAASLLELLDAQRTYMATHQAYLATLQDYWEAYFGLEAAINMELRR